MPRLETISRLSAVLLGLALPAMISGRATLGLFLGLGVLGTFLVPEFSVRMKRTLFLMRSPLGVGLLALTAIWLLSSASSISVSVSLQVQLRIVVFLFCASWVISFLSENKSRIAVYQKSSLVLGLILSVVAVIGLTVLPELISLLKSKPIEDLRVARIMLREFGSLATLLIPAFVWFGYCLGGAWRYVGALTAILSFAIIYLTSSQSAFAGLLGVGFVIIVCALFVRFSWRRYIFIATGLGVFVVLVGAIQLSGIVGGLPQAYYDRVAALDLFLPHWLVDPHRQVIWQHVFELGMQKPWLGWGINTINYADLVERHAVGVFTGWTPYTSHPHNWVLEIFSETGIVGLSGLLVVVFMLFWLPFRAFRDTRDPVFLVILAVTAGFWSASLFNFSFWSAWWQVSYFLLLSTLMASTGSAAVSSISKKQ